MSSNNTELRRIPGYSRYFAGSDGEVYSSISGATKKLKVCLRKQDGRGRLSLTDDHGKLRRKYRSYFILLAWIGPCPPGKECLHADGNCKNDKPSNLRWGTSVENKADMLKHGTRQSGEQINTAKLSASDVRTIRQLRAEGVTLRVLAVQFGVTEANVSAIYKRKTWRAIT